MLQPLHGIGHPPWELHPSQRGRTPASRLWYSHLDLVGTWGPLDWEAIQSYCVSLPVRDDSPSCLMGPVRQVTEFARTFVPDRPSTPGSLRLTW